MANSQQKKLYQVYSSYFTAGFETDRETVTCVAPILSYIKGWSIDKVIQYCKSKKFKIKEVKKMNTRNFFKTLGLLTSGCFINRFSLFEEIKHPIKPIISKNAQKGIYVQNFEYREIQEIGKFTKNGHCRMRLISDSLAFNYTLFSDGRTYWFATEKIDLHGNYLGLESCGYKEFKGSHGVTFGDKKMFPYPYRLAYYFITSEPVRGFPINMYYE